MITFVPLTELPDDVPAKAAEQARQSIGVWSARYGDVNDSNGHIEVGVFGFVPTDYLARRGYFWLCPREHTGRKMLAEAKRAFFSFSVEFGWDSFIFTEMRAQPARRFAQFMGYRESGQAEGFQFYTRPE